MTRYSKTITRLVLGLDVLLIVLTMYQVNMVVRADSVTSYAEIFYFWVAGFIGVSILTASLRFNVITFFAVPFFLPALWFISACLLSYVHHPYLFDTQMSLFVLTVAFFVIYLGLLLASVYMGVKRPRIKQDEITEQVVEDEFGATI